jgi:hypothetical protein
VIFVFPLDALRKKGNRSPGKNYEERIMKTVGSVVSLIMTAVAALMMTPAGWTHDTDWVLGAFGTAIVDGVLSSGEWDGAASKTFDVNLPAHDGGGTTPATIYVMNDAVNLYIAFRVERSAGGSGTFGLATNPALFFDADHDNLRELGDDGFGMSVGVFQPATFIDTYVFDSAGNTADDVTDGGTTDGLAAASVDTTSAYVEMSHPLDSADNAHDFSLSGGDVIGFGGLMNLFSVDTSCTPNEIGSPCQAFTGFAGSFTAPVGDIFLLSPVPGVCERDAVEARRRFVDTCIAAGGSPASCNRAGNEILIAGLAGCRAP